MNEVTQQKHWYVRSFSDFNEVAAFLNEHGFTPQDVHITGYSRKTYGKELFFEITVLYFGDTIPRKRDVIQDKPGSAKIADHSSWRDGLGEAVDELVAEAKACEVIGRFHEAGGPDGGNPRSEQ